MPIANCFPSEIVSNLLLSCDTDLTKGVDTQYYIGQTRNLSARPTLDSTGTFINTVPMKSGKKLIRAEGYGYSTKPKATFSESDTVGIRFPQEMTVTLVVSTPAERAQIEAAARSQDSFFIYKKKGAGADFEEVGIFNGMKLSSLNYEPSSDDAGAITLVFVNPDAKRLPLIIRHTASGVDDTAAYLETLALAVS